MRYSIRERRGFTLVELMISIAIIMMMVAITLPAFSNFQRRQDLLSATQVIRDAILEAHNLALAPRAGAGAGDTGKDDGADIYRVVFYSEDDGQGQALAKYQIQEQDTEETTPEDWSTIKTGQLSARIVYCTTNISQSLLSASATNITDSDGLQFSISQQGKIVAPTTAQARLILASTSSGERREVTVYPVTGQVDVLDADNSSTC